MQNWKWIFLGVLLCLPFAAVAEDLQPAAGNDKDKNITIVNGKKFFSLRNARHFSGDVKPMPAGPQKQFRAPPLIQHNQMLAPSAMKRNGTDMHSDTPAHAASTTDTPPESKPAAGDSNSRVLDIFTPKEKGQ